MEKIPGSSLKDKDVSARIIFPRTKMYLFSHLISDLF